MKKPIRGIILNARSEDAFNDHEDINIMRLLDVARKRGIDLSVLRPDQFELVISKQDDKKSILVDDKPRPLPDFVLPRMGWETTHYAFSVIRQLQYLGVYVCNDADAIYAVKDKLYMHQLLSRSKLSSPRTMLAKYPIALEVVKREIGFPLVIKNVTGSLGSGIYLCESPGKFMDVMELVYTNNPHANLILQEFIAHSSGRDLRVFVVGGKVIGCIQRSSTTSFKANYSKGGSVDPYPLSPEIEWLATETAKLFNLDIAGIDLLFCEDEFKICEANSSPGFCGLEKVIGATVAEQIIDYILVRIGLNSEVS